MQEPLDEAVACIVQRTLSLPEKLLWFANMVRQGGEWDYKRYISAFSPHDSWSEQRQFYQDFGNFNYGAAGTAAGFGGEFLARMAGLFQAYRDPDWGHWYGDRPYGDNPRAQYYIGLGIGYARVVDPCP